MIFLSDLFSELVPVAVHQALASYDLRKTEIVNTEISKLRDATQLLNGLLASLNLPAAIEATDGASSVPPSILEKANIVSSLGGITDLERMISELPELLKRNQDILNEVMNTSISQNHETTFDFGTDFYLMRQCSILYFGD